MSNSRLKESATANIEMTEPIHSNNTGEDSSTNMRIGENQPPVRGTTIGGKWGSTFWKDYRPATTSRGASESGEESKSGSEYKVSEVEGESDGVENRMESENDDMTQKEVISKGHQTVPVDEMLSDEYYEQDGDDPNESLNHYRAMNNASGYSLKLPPQPAGPSSISRKSKGLKTNKYVNEDADYEDDEDEDEDDPDDVDFDPDYGAISGHRQIKDKDEDWDAEESDEEDIVDDHDLDISDEEDSYFKKNRAKQSNRGGRSLKSTSEMKSIALSTRRKKGRTSFGEDEEESSAEDSENGSDENYFKSTRRGATVQRKIGGRSASLNISGRNNEIRTSGRSVRKVSYVESDESEDFDEAKKKTQKKEEIEEEDGDAIEKVLWHQPKDTMEETLKNTKSSELVLLSYLFDSEPD